MHIEGDIGTIISFAKRDEQSSQGERFGFAASDQLVSARYNADQVWTGAAVNGTRAVDYGYTPDRLNRSSMNDNGWVGGYAASAVNQYTSFASRPLSYDGNFNLTSYAGGNYSYDAQNHLVSASGPGGNMQGSRPAERWV